jgi:tetratricopeptide (TPR) repeat protein
MVTEEMSEDKVIYAVEEGVDGYQQKPFTEERIMDAIKSIFRRRLNPDKMQHQIQKLSLLKIYERYDEAIDYAQQLLKEKEHPTVLSILAECYFNRGDFENARKYIDRLMDMKIDSKALDLLGKICMKEEKYDEALQYFKQSSVKNPLNRNRKIELGNVYVKLGLANEATEVFEAIAESNPTDLNLVDMGKVYLNSGNIKKAGKFLEQASDPIPETLEVFNKYAVELRRIGKYEGAIQQYLKCLSLVPGNPIILYNLGRVYFEIERNEEAIVALEECIKSEPMESARRLLDYIRKTKSK